MFLAHRTASFGIGHGFGRGSMALPPVLTQRDLAALSRHSRREAPRRSLSARLFERLAAVLGKPDMRR